MHRGIERRRREAEERNAFWAVLTASEKLRVLSTRPGKSVKQIAKIKKQEAERETKQ